MSQTSSKLLHRGLFGLGAGIFLMATMLASAAPALAEQHARKPHKLWRQYPLKVQVPTPSVTPSVARSTPPAATPSAAKSQPASSSDTRDARSPNAALTSGKLFVLGGAGILLAALLVIVMRTRSPVVADVPDPDDTRSPEPETEVSAEGEKNGYKKTVVQAAAEPWMGPAPTRVRLKLEDGRSLEGFTRESGSPNSDLVILEVVAAFDENGNNSPPKPSDSFILRSEIASMQRMDDS